MSTYFATIEPTINPIQLNTYLLGPVTWRAMSWALWGRTDAGGRLLRWIRQMYPENDITSEVGSQYSTQIIIIQVI